mgnify:CR=1 FL=1
MERVCWLRRRATRAALKGAAPNGRRPAPRNYVTGRRATVALNSTRLASPTNKGSPEEVIWRSLHFRPPPWLAYFRPPPSALGRPFVRLFVCLFVESRANWSDMSIDFQAALFSPTSSCRNQVSTAPKTTTASAAPAEAKKRWRRQRRLRGQLGGRKWRRRRRRRDVPMSAPPRVQECGRRVCVWRARSWRRLFCFKLGRPLDLSASSSRRLRNWTPIERRAESLGRPKRALQMINDYCGLRADKSADKRDLSALGGGGGGGGGGSASQPVRQPTRQPASQSAGQRIRGAQISPSS